MEENVLSCSFSPLGTYLQLNEASHLHVFSSNLGENVTNSRFDTSIRMAVWFDDSNLLCLSTDGQLLLHNVVDKEISLRIENSNIGDKNTKIACIDVDAKTLLIGTQDGNLWLTKLEENRDSNSAYSFYKDTISKVRWCRNEDNFFGFCAAANSIAIWKVGQYSPICFLDFSNKEIVRDVIWLDVEHLITNTDNSISIWKLNHLNGRKYRVDHVNTLSGQQNLCFTSKNVWECFA